MQQLKNTINKPLNQNSMRNLESILMAICGILIFLALVGFSIGVFMMSSRAIMVSASIVFMAGAFYFLAHFIEFLIDSL